MTLTEILNEIKKQRVELEVYQELHKWIIGDRSAWIDRTMDSESSIRAIRKIANGNKNTKEAIKGIKTICEFDEEK